jgi:polysaccharide deacetylase 2 family uncharacterized protein YibQ
MVAKKQKRKIKTKKIDPKGFLLLFSLLILSITILGLFLYISNSTSNISPPIYEEIYSKTSDLTHEIGKIDNTIYESLYQRGIQDKNVFFPTVEPKHSDGYDWDFTELLVYLSNYNSVLRFEKIISIELSHLKPSVNFKKERVNHEIVCNIFALGFLTHKIRLIPKEFQKTIHKRLPKIGIIIDDLGYDRDIATSFIRSNLSLSLSVLPLAPYTRHIVNEANKSGLELILHLPMEPKGYPNLNPGPGALLIDMDEKDIRRTINSHLRRIPGVRGVNNHMGSCFTERKDKMSVVLSELKRRNLFYIDSRTTSQTVAFNMAKKAGVPVAKRSVFLDNDLSPRAIRFQMQRLVGIARHSGTAIGIGHPHKETLRILKDYLHRYKKKVETVLVSKIVS